MSRATLAAAKAELIALVSSNGAATVTGVDAVYDHLPPLTVLAGSTSLCIFTAGISPEFWLIAVRVYKNVSSDMKTSQDQLDLLLPAIDAATVDSGGWGPSEWSIDYPTGDVPMLIATNVYQVGRQDYF